MKMTLNKLFRDCSTSLSDLISYFRLNGTTDCDVSSIEDEFGRLRVWASSTGAVWGGGRDSIDFRLQHSGDISKSVAVTLADIANSAREIHRIEASPSSIPYEERIFDEDSSSDESIGEIMAKEAILGAKFVPLAQTDIQQHCSNIEKGVNNLYSLSRAILNPAPENMFLVSGRIDRSYFEPGDIERILENFPLAEWFLVEKLGKANTKRRQLFDYLERRNGRASQIPNKRSFETFARLSTSQEWSTTSHTPALMEIGEYNDSSSSKGDKEFVSKELSVPSITQIYRGLPAYVCTHPDCYIRIQLFSNRNDWYQHERQHYAKEFTCSLCKENYSTEDTFKNHLTSSHNAHPDQLEFLVELSQQTRTEIILPTCPLCAQEINDYKTHMGDHLQDIALFILPRALSKATDTKEIASNEAQKIENISKATEAISELSGLDRPLSFEDQQVVSDVDPKGKGTEKPAGSYYKEMSPLISAPRAVRREGTKISNNLSSQGQGKQNISVNTKGTTSSPSINIVGYIHGPEDPGLSFIFIVNKLKPNEDQLPPRYENDKWVPPVHPQGFHQQIPGQIYRWDNGRLTQLDNYTWHDMAIESDAYNEAARGIVASLDGYPLQRYRTTTMFYANPYLKFLTVSGDASARSLYNNGEIWHPLRFHHTPEPSNISVVDHCASNDYLAGDASRSPWYKEVIPKAYNCPDDNPGTSGGLAGLLPVLIALMAFSCSSRELENVLKYSWRNRNWIRHDRRTGRREKRGMVVTVYLDPENPQGSTRESLHNFESLEGLKDDRPILRQGLGPI